MMMMMINVNRVTSQTNQQSTTQCNPQLGTQVNPAYEYTLPVELWGKIFRSACSLDEDHHLVDMPYDDVAVVTEELHKR